MENQGPPARPSHQTPAYQLAVMLALVATLSPFVDTSFDMRTDTPPGRDPDSHSPTLRRYHQLLWDKALPSGRRLELRSDVPGAYLLHKSDLGRFRLSSDTIANSHRKRLSHFYSAMPTGENERFHRLGYTIGGSLVFPGNRVNGNQTINQRRGTHRLIEDRIDLTLECIRRHYSNEESPLSTTLAFYADFFALFECFEGYVDFFLLQDLVTPRSEVAFFLPFDGFRPSPLPGDLAAYREYRERTLAFVESRNRRIAQLNDSVSSVNR